MRFALVGDHSDGLAMTGALLASGRHVLAAYSGPVSGADYLKRFHADPARVNDVEELLADPLVEMVILASPLSVRHQHLRRALQSERHVLSVHPCASKADLAYEMSMIQSDTHRLLLPLLPMSLHPGIRRFRDLPGSSRVLELEWWSTDEVLLEKLGDDPKPSLPCWDMLRSIGGEIAEIFAQSIEEDLLDEDAILVAGRFVSGELLRVTLLPQQTTSQCRLRRVHFNSIQELTFPDGWPGRAELRYLDERGEPCEESFPAFDPWEAMVHCFEDSLAALPVPHSGQRPAQVSSQCLTTVPSALTWGDEIRGLELDENIRRSLRYRRAYTLDLLEADEEVNFKGTMTLVGCSLIWILVLALIISMWIPWMLWLCLGILAIFLGLQGLRWVVPEKDSKEKRR